MKHQWEKSQSRRIEDTMEQLLWAERALESIEAQMPEDGEASDDLLAKHIEVSDEVDYLTGLLAQLRAETYEEAKADFSYDEWKSNRK